MNYLLYCKSHRREADKMHVEQKEARCIFFDRPNTAVSSRCWCGSCGSRQLEAWQRED